MRNNLSCRFSAEIESNTPASLHTTQQEWQSAAGHWEHPGTTCSTSEPAQPQSANSSCLSHRAETQLCLSSHSVRKRLPNKHNTWEENHTESPSPSQPPSAHCCKPAAPCLLAPVTQPGLGVGNAIRDSSERHTELTVHCLAICWFMSPGSPQPHLDNSSLLP